MSKKNSLWERRESALNELDLASQSLEEERGRPDNPDNLASFLEERHASEFTEARYEKARGMFDQANDDLDQARRDHINKHGIDDAPS